MKFLIVSDQIDPFVYSYAIKDLFKDVSAVLCAGDLPMEYIDFIVSTLNKPTYFVFGNHNLNEYKYYHKEVPDKDTLYNAGKAEEHAHGAIYAGFKVITDESLKWTDPATGKETPLLIAGISGSRNYNNGLCQYTEAQMKLKLLQMAPKLLYNKLKYGRYLDIFLTHATPRHVHDHEDPCHKGFKVFNEFIKKYRPTYMVHGHIHLYDLNEKRISEYEGTTVVNAYGHYVIDLPVSDLSQLQITDE